MSFPLTYTLKVPLNNSITSSNAQHMLRLHFRRYPTIAQETIKYKSSFLGYLYPVDYSIKNQSVILNIHFTPVINTLLFFFLITGLLSSISFFTFLWLSLFLSIIFYSITFLIITRQLKQEIHQIFGIYTPLQQEEIISKEQQTWLNDTSLCPACGNRLKDSDLHCPSCGLRVKQNRFSKPLEWPSTNTNTITYHYTEKKQ